MPGAAVTSKLDSSSIMMTCGRVTDASQSAGGARDDLEACAPRASGSEGWAGGSASIHPVDVRRDTATTPDRERLETWLTPWNGSQGCSGTAIAMAEIATVANASSASETLRLTRNGSVRQISHSTGTAAIAASTSGNSSAGKTESKRKKWCESIS